MLFKRESTEANDRITYQPKSTEILLGGNCVLGDSYGPPAVTHTKLEKWR